jgi:hypothetical protein
MHHHIPDDPLYITADAFVELPDVGFVEKNFRCLCRLSREKAVRKK